ncbi:MAG: hypothetical protein ABF812_15300 [Gluconobacter cerinus]|uniref:hypothetical protein n=1 Tax=Gluconobacter cerinus TaxID=38307 RepID=UPI0039E84596
MTLSTKPTINGTWIIERQLSSWSNGLFPHESMDLCVSLRIENGNLFYHSVNRSNPDAPPSHFRFDIPLDNCSYPFTGSQRFDHLRGRLLPDGALEILKLQDGAIVIAEIWRRHNDHLLFRWGVSCSAPQSPKARKPIRNISAPSSPTEPDLMLRRSEPGR